MHETCGGPGSQAKSAKKPGVLEIIMASGIILG